MEGRRGVIYRLIRILHPLRELAEAGRRALAQHARVIRLPPQTRLLAAQERRWLTYVVKGELSIHGPTGERELVPAGSERALRPLFEIMPAGLEAVACTGTVVLRFDRSQVGELMNAQTAPRLQALPCRTDVAARILQACRSGETSLPPSLSIVPSLDDVLLDKRAGLKQLARIIAQVPELAQRFVASANNGQTHPPAVGVAEAVLRMGLAGTRTLAVALAVQPLFRAASPLLNRRMEACYAHSVFIGSLAYVLARQTQGVVPERALLAGMLHDMGAAAVLGYFDRPLAPTVTEAELDDHTKRLCSLAGPLLISRLRVAPEIACVTERAERWFRRSGSRIDYGDLLVLAHLLESNGPGAGRPRLDEVPAYAKLGWDTLVPQLSARLIAAARSLSAAIRRRTG